MLRKDLQDFEEIEKTDSKLDCSIIIVNYNGLQMLKDCLDSLVMHTAGVSYEVIIVDNNSSEKGIEGIAGLYENTTLIRNSENLGFAAANNQGLGIAKGKYILLLNNDTIFIENTLREIVEFAESKNGEVIAGCKILNPDLSHQISIVEFDGIWNSFTEAFFLNKIFPGSRFFNKCYQNYIKGDEPFETDFVKGCFLLCPRKAAMELNGLDERFFFYMEETDFCYRYKLWGGKVFYYPNTSIIHLGGATTERMQWFKFKNQSVAKVKFYQKHFKGIKFFLTVSLHYTGMALRVIVYFLMGVLGIKVSMLTKSYYYFRLLFIYPKNLFAG